MLDHFRLLRSSPRRKVDDQRQPRAEPNGAASLDRSRARAPRHQRVFVRDGVARSVDLPLPDRGQPWRPLRKAGPIQIVDDPGAVESGSFPRWSGVVGQDPAR